MSEPTKEELLAFMRKHGLENVDSITDTESAIRHFRCTSKIYKEQRDQYKQAYQHCVDDLIVLRANNKRLERENGELRTKLENAETYIDAIKTYYPMYENLSNRYNALTNHIRTKAECNPGVDRYIALVNYIDRLERK